MPEGTGWIEVVCGSMFSGKTEELVRRLKRALIARQRVQVFKPATDDRYDRNAVVSHGGARIEGIAVASAPEILEKVADDVDVVGIDEVQFFDADVVQVADELANRGIRVICAGLDQDFQGQPFEPMPQLMAVAEFVHKALAVCVVCGNPANRSQRLTASETQVVVGATEHYEARCRRCHTSQPVSAPEQEALPMALEPIGRGAVPTQPPLPFDTRRTETPAHRASDRHRKG